MIVSTANIKTEAREVRVDDDGSRGAAIVMAHGFALDRSMFDGAIPASPDRRVITWDAPGHGDSPASDEPFSFWDLARDQLAVMDALGIDKAAVGGCSQGGFIALRTALLAPERVTALILIDTEAAALDTAETAAYQNMFAALAEAGPTPELTTALSGQIIGDHPAADTWARTWQTRGIPLGHPVDCLLNRDDITDQLPQIRVPALVVRGEHDHSIPPERQQQLRDALPGPSEVLVINGAGHSPTVTHPYAVRTAVDHFLTATTFHLQ
ncbi:alpha/beta fold hydrolase [Pseudonocardia sp. ICBG601]|uniref:alpha/beta fold hydrolase n=1 Tax=Pseudonocardia sp. ICBG601 TaxID=2846759 RepID=UPI001CF6E704|nr:alpha/beta hydrolase [Pseudonocardia sp. ICBG601]